MSYKYIEYIYPNTQLISKIIFWADKNCNCYFALKNNYTDNWVYYAGTVAHALALGKILTSYGLVEADAQTNFLTTVRDSLGKNLVIFPTNIEAKYVRLYVETGNNVSITELTPSTYFTANEIISGTLEITDLLADAPLIKVVANSVDRIKIGNVGTAYGLFGYNASAATIFELSDALQKISSFTFATSDLHAGSGATRIQFDTTKGIHLGATDFASAPFRVSLAGNLFATSASISGEITALSGSIGGCTIATNYIESNPFVSGVLGSGWRINKNGIAEFQNVSVRGTIKTSVFEKDTISCVNGYFMVSKADVLANDMTALDASTFTISGSTTFTTDEIVRIKDGTYDEWLRITSATSAPIYTVARDLASTYATDNNPVWKKGTAIVSMGVGTADKTGFIVFDSSSVNSPFIDVYGRNSITYSDYTLHTRIGWLKGVIDADVGLDGDDVWGIYCDNAYIKGTLILDGDFKTSPTVGTTKGIHMDSTNNELYFYGDRGDAVVDKIASVGITDAGADYAIGLFGCASCSIIPIVAISAGSAISTPPSIVGISGEGIGIVGFSGNFTDDWFWTGIFKEIGVQGQSINGYGGYFGCGYGGTAGLAQIVLNPSTYSAPTHDAVQGAILVDNAANAWINYGGTPKWRCFSNIKLHYISQLATADGNIIVGDGTQWVAESGATARTSLGLGTTATASFNAIKINHIGEQTGSHNIIIDNNMVLLNHNQLFGYTTGGTPTALIGILSDNTVYVGYGLYNVNIGNTAITANPIYIRVNGANNQQITVGAENTGGSGYRLLRVPN